MISHIFINFIFDQISFSQSSHISITVKSAGSYAHIFLILNFIYSFHRGCELELFLYHPVLTHEYFKLCTPEFDQIRYRYKFLPKDWDNVGITVNLNPIFGRD